MGKIIDFFTSLFIRLFLKICKCPWTRLAILTHKRNELCLELVAQLSIHFTMVLLSNTKYPIETGLQTIFIEKTADTNPQYLIAKNIVDKLEEISKETPLAFFIFSTVWSFKTCALTSLKIKNESKGSLPFLGKLILFVRYLMIVLVRVGSIVAYYSPFIGLWDIMSHYKAETIPLDYKLFKRLNETKDQSYHYWNPIVKDYQSVKISDLFRSNYENTQNNVPSPPSTQLYTIISLRSAFITFWFLYLFYGLALTLFKHCKSKDFQNASHGKRIQHILEAINIPEAFADWDNNHTLDVAGHRRKWKTVLIEMVWMVVMQFASNMVLLIPIFVTGTLSLYRQCAYIIFL